MAAPLPQNVAPPLPPALVNCIVRNAEEDAGRVVEFLNRCSFHGGQREGVPVRLPAMALLGLGIAMRLLEWETSGIRIHRDAGLPAAADVLRGVLADALRDPSPSSSGASTVVRYWTHVLDLMANHLAWEGIPLVGAEFVVGRPDDEDAFVDSLAQLLWANRHLRNRHEQDD